MVAELHIRPATPADAHAVAAYNVMADEGLPLLAWEKVAAPGQDPMEVGAALARKAETATGVANTDLAVLEDRVLGAVCSYQMPPPLEGPAFMAPFRTLKTRFAGQWYVDFIAVAQEARGLGVAAALLDAAGARARNAQVDTLFLLVLDTNTAAHRAYQKAGFAVAAEADIPPGRPWPPEEATKVTAYTRTV